MVVSSLSKTRILNLQLNTVSSGTGRQRKIVVVQYISSILTNLRAQTHPLSGATFFHRRTSIGEEYSYL